ncbi:hypothetical protein CHU92_01765 [Flavobacterium cyanobacteriorum]|uniref:GLPGLI family protein n=1 Tax=Flavobacterium cyanobacteriorum TaxID=2022802 RepID=A0A255ZYL8_9FLAO|nr:hypothetical protein CHU92_01765 [Flavobacterium cyanobacteriorum]
MIDSETKVFGTYKCKKATMVFRGRAYTAWFSEDFPVNAGPFKFGGLPGLIFEIYDTDNQYRWILKSITKNDGEQLKEPQLAYENIDLRTYVRLLDEQAQDIQQYQKSRQPKGVSTENTTFKRASVELVYEWE